MTQTSLFKLLSDGLEKAEKEAFEDEEFDRGYWTLCEVVKEAMSRVSHPDQLPLGL